VKLVSLRRQSSKEIEKHLVQPRRATKNSRAWQKKHDETTESLQANQDILVLANQEQGTLLFFAVTIALIVSVFSVYKAIHYFFPGVCYKILLFCTSSLITTTHRVLLILDVQRRKPKRAYDAYREMDNSCDQEENGDNRSSVLSGDEHV
jgi:hypothetical protein